MRTNRVLFWLGLLAIGCANVPAPVTSSPDSPAHPEAAEAVAPPFSPELMRSAGPPAPAPSANAGEDEHAGHGSDSEPGSPSTPTPESTTYTCPMHPEVTSDEPGSCPKCGMTLVPKEPEEDHGEHHE